MAFKTRLHDFIERHFSDGSVHAKYNRLRRTTSAIPSITSDNSDSSPLLRLPAELRLLIYMANFKHNLLGADNLTLLLTCRQIHHEAKEIGQKNTTFALSARDLDTKLRNLNGISNPEPHRKSRKCTRTEPAGVGLGMSIAHIYQPHFCTTLRLDMSHSVHLENMTSWITALEIRELVLINISRTSFTESSQVNAEYMLGLMILYVLVFKMRSVTTLTLLMDSDSAADVTMMQHFSELTTFRGMLGIWLRRVRIEVQVPKHGHLIFSANAAEGGPTHTLDVQFLDPSQSVVVGKAVLHG